MIDQKMKTIEKAEADDCALGSVAMDDRRLLRKIDWHLLPIMFLTYFLQMIDKISINVCSSVGTKMNWQSMLTVQSMPM